MKAPDKLYISKNIYSTFMYQVPDPDDKTEVEYIRADAFIEKAAIWFNNNFMIHDEYGVISDSFDTKEEMYEDFKNYIKGE